MRESTGGKPLRVFGATGEKPKLIWRSAMGSINSLENPP